MSRGLHRQKALRHRGGGAGLCGTSLNLNLVAVCVAAVLCFGVVVAAGVAVTAAMEALEVVGMFLIGTVLGIRAVVAVARIELVIDVAVEARTTAIVGSCSDESAADKPLGSVVSVGCATVWAVAVVTVGARGADANADRDLGLRFGRSGCAKTTEQRSDEKDILDSAHEIPHRV